MVEREGCIELKFRVYDGTDICQGTYESSTTIAFLKQKLVSEWPQDKPVIPKSACDIELIHAGKVLENDKTLAVVAESRIHIGDLSGGIITMHVVVKPPVTQTKIDKNKQGKGNENTCSCTIT